MLRERLLKREKITLSIPLLSQGEASRVLYRTSCTHHSQETCLPGPRGRENPRNPHRQAGAAEVAHPAASLCRHFASCPKARPGLAWLSKRRPAIIHKPCPKMIHLFRSNPSVCYTANVIKKQAKKQKQAKKHG